jgi:hypothetical protein
MKLTDLDPRWLIKDGRRIGFTFISPTDPKWRQSCFVEKTPHKVQWDLFELAYGEHCAVQGCNTDAAWIIEGEIDKADFTTMSVTPSLDGSKGGLWHGFITRGQIVNA